MQKNGLINDPLWALNLLEDGHKLLVSLSGNYLSSVFQMTSEGMQSYNTETGPRNDWTKGELYKHFDKLLHAGAEIVTI